MKKKKKKNTLPWGTACMEWKWQIDLSISS